MPTPRTVEPIAPATIPGEPLDPKIPPELEPDSDLGDESDEERQARESEQAFDRAIARTPPG
jgi:hypothetical protein